jgi:hypothetical protein
MVVIIYTLLLIVMAGSKQQVISILVSRESNKDIARGLGFGLG